MAKNLIIYYSRTSENYVRRKVTVLSKGNTEYDDIKNKLKIESFSGTSPLAIRQDFFTTMFLNNLASIMIAENADETDKLHNSEQNKYQYKANINTTFICCLKKWYSY